MPTPEEPKTNAMDDAQLGEVNGGVRICQVETSDPIPAIEDNANGPVCRRPFPEKTVTNY